MCVCQVNDAWNHQNLGEHPDVGFDVFRGLGFRNLNPKL